MKMKAAHWIVALFLALDAHVATPADSAAQSYRGKISAVDRAAHTLTMETPTGSQTFAVGSNSRLLATPLPAAPLPTVPLLTIRTDVSFDSLAVGQEIVVLTHDSDAAEARIAASIEIVDPAALTGQLEELGTPSIADTATIVRTNPSNRSIEVDTRQGPLRYRIDDETRIRSASEALALADLVTGQRVVISARREGKEYVATEVVVVALGPEPAPASSLQGATQ